MNDTATPPVALVTGASRGLGRAIALALGGQGYQTVLVARTVGALEELDDELRALGAPQPLLVPLNLTDFDAIDRLGASLNERYGRVDLLVSAAGDLGVLSPVGHITPKVWQTTLDLNLTSSWRLIRSLDPLLRQSPNGRALFVSCAAASELQPFWGLYAASKAALEALVTCYARESERLGPKVHLLVPGPMRTALRAKAFPGEPEDQQEDPAAVAKALMTQLLQSPDALPFKITL